jgi:hypothetical protein
MTSPPDPGVDIRGSAGFTGGAAAGGAPAARRGALDR